jgi:hypothetical protein
LKVFLFSFPFCAHHSGSPLPTLPIFHSSTREGKKVVEKQQQQQQNDLLAGIAGVSNSFLALSPFFISFFIYTHPSCTGFRQRQGELLAVHRAQRLFSLVSSLTTTFCPLFPGFSLDLRFACTIHLGLTPSPSPSFFFFYISQLFFTLAVVLGCGAALGIFRLT